MMRVGNATMRPVVEIEQLSLPPNMFIDEFTLTDVEPHAHWLSPQFFDSEVNACLLSQHAWLIEVKDKRILVDPCVGHQRNRPSLQYYHMLDSPFLDRLAALGATPESIDIVFCTHLHLDHCGWNTRLQDGRWVPTFPNARYIFSRAEEDFWRRELAGEVPEQIFNAFVYDECVAPVIAAGLADLVDPGARIADCITLIDAGGHTAGHVAGVLESGGEGAVLAGDAIHHPIQVLYPDRPIHADEPERARLTRHRLLTLCAEKDYWFAPAHFRAPHMCKIRQDGAAYRMEWPG